MKLAYEKLKSVNDELTLFLFKEDALIYSSRTKRLHLLNALGIFIWLQLEEGLTQQQVIDVCIQNGTANNTANKQALLALVAELHLLMQKGEIEENHLEVEELWLNEVKLENFTNDDTLLEEPYRILDVNVYFSFPNSKVEAWFKPLLSQFKCLEKFDNPVENKNITLKISLDETNLDETANYRLSMNNYLFSWAISSQRLVSFVLDRLRKVAFHFSEKHSGAHAAVLSKGNVCILMPAKSYSGKSTLSAALVAKGYQYLSDEMAVIDAKFQARPVPLGLGLKEGSWKILKNYIPQIEQVAAMERWDGVPIKYLPIKYLSQNNSGNNKTELKGNALSLERKKITHLVIPNYQHASLAKLSALSVAQTMYELFQAGYTQGKDMSEESVEELIHQLSQRPCYHFAFDNLEQAVLALDALDAL